MNVFFLGECFELHVQKLKRILPRESEKYCHHVEDFLVWFLDPSTQEPNIDAIATVVRADIEAYLEERRNYGNNLKTRTEQCSALKDYFCFLISNGLLKSDPASDITCPTV
jgi:site-specific recombinase XerD